MRIASWKKEKEDERIRKEATEKDQGLLKQQQLEHQKRQRQQQQRMKIENWRKEEEDYKSKVKKSEQIQMSVKDKERRSVFSAEEMAERQARDRELTQMHLAKREAAQVSLSLRLRLKGLFLYTGGIFCHMEWCIGQLWCSFIILYNITSIAYNYHTDIYPRYTSTYIQDKKNARAIRSKELSEANLGVVGNNVKADPARLHTRTKAFQAGAIDGADLVEMANRRASTKVSIYTDTPRYTHVTCTLILHIYSYTYYLYTPVHIRTLIFTHKAHDGVMPMSGRDLQMGGRGKVSWMK